MSVSARKCRVALPRKGQQAVEHLHVSDTSSLTHLADLVCFNVERALSGGNAQEVILVKKSGSADSGEFQETILEQSLGVGTFPLM